MRRSEVGSGERYRPAELLGEDALGTLWSGTDTLSGDPVVVRILPEGLLADAGAVRQVTNALERMRGHAGNAHLPRLLHHNLRRPGEGAAFVVSEGSGVETLARRLERGGLSPRVALHVTAAVANGLAAAHDAWVYHGALTASSVVVDRGSVVKVVDVGLGDLLAPQQPGTPPMNLSDRGSLDVLAVATLFEQVLSGAPRWQATPATETPQPWLDQVPTEVQALMRRARSPHRLQRPRMAELAAALAPALEPVPGIGSAPFGVARPDVAAGPGAAPVMLPAGPRGVSAGRPPPPRPDDRAVAAAGLAAGTAASSAATPPSLEATGAPDAAASDRREVASEAPAGPTVSATTTETSGRWRGAVLAIASVILLAMLGVGVYLGVDALRAPSAPPPQSSLTPFPSTSVSPVASPTPSGVASPTPSAVASATPSSSPSPSATSSIEPTTVPVVIGLSVERATDRLEGAGLVVGPVESVAGPLDTVVSSDPTQGEAVTAGTVVTLSVGDGSSP